MQPEAVSAALWQDAFNVFVTADVVLMTLAVGAQKELFRALGFERLPGDYPGSNRRSRIH